MAKDSAFKYDKLYEPFVVYMLSSKHGIRTKSAIEVGRRAVEYFRGSDFLKWLKKNGGTLKETHSEIFKDIDFENSDDLMKFGNELIEKSFILRSSYKPVGQIEKDEKGDMKIPKWPKRLSVTQNQSFNEAGFYIITYEGNKAWSHILMTTILVSVMVMCMFPAWPLFLKLGLWYLSVVFMTFILSIVIGRLILFMLFWFFGVDFWLFPNIFDEEAGIIDSFKPIYSWLHRSDDWMMLIARLVCGFLLIISIFQLNKTHTVSSVGDFARQSLIDILDWGHRKLAPPENGGTDLSGIRNSMDAGVHKEDMENDKCLLKCLRFDTYEDAEEDCGSDCQCISELLSLPCVEEKAVCSGEIYEKLLSWKIRSCEKDEL